MNHDKTRNTYILDTSALMTYIENEDGSEYMALRLGLENIKAKTGYEEISASNREPAADLFIVYSFSLIVFSSSSTSARSFFLSEHLLHSSKSFRDMMFRKFFLYLILFFFLKTSSLETPLRLVNKSIRLGSTPR